MATQLAGRRWGNREPTGGAPRPGRAPPIPHARMPLVAALPRPHRDQLSTLGALVLLAIGLVRVVSLPTLPIEFSAAGLLIRLEFSSAFVLIVLAAALTVTGADWLARSHPRRPSGWSRLESVIVPGLATLAAGAILTRVEPGPTLWLGLVAAGGALMAILLAEFVVLDRTDPRREAAAVGLTVLALVLLTGVYFALFALGVRIVFGVPITFLATFAVGWRLLRLHLPEAGSLLLPLAIGTVATEVGWGLHYWPLAPAQPALLLGLLAYLSIQAAIAHRRGRLTAQRAGEYALVAAAGLAGIILLR